MGKRFTFKGNEYRVDDEGNIYENGLFGNKVGEMDQDGNFTIKTGIFSEEKGRISSWTGDVIERDIFGGDKEKVGKEKLCFLSEACFQYAGRADDCFELHLLRKFRDEYVRLLPDGNNLIEDYYQTAPFILERIRSRNDADSIFSDLMKIIQHLVALIQTGEHAEALTLCKREFQKLKDRFGIR